MRAKAKAAAGGGGGGDAPARPGLPKPGGGMVDMFAELKAKKEAKDRRRAEL